MSFEMNGVTYEPPIEIVEDLDGDEMPFNPEDIVWMESPLPAGINWTQWWCPCGHLVMDHHAKPDFMETHTMTCWAVDCPCDGIKIGT